MTAVRPPIFPPSQAAQPARPDPARLAAQKAFFEAALGKTAAPRAAAQVPGQAPVQTPVQAAAGPPAQPPRTPVQRLPDPTAEPPQRILRPGSLLDIRV